MSETKEDYGKVNDVSIRAEELLLTQDWDKVFPLSTEVNHGKVTFVNYFGITLATDMYDHLDVIPFEKLKDFFVSHLNSN